MAKFPEKRMRRLRLTESLRELVRETVLLPQNLIMPIFIVPGEKLSRPISSMPGQFQLSVDRAVEKCRIFYDLGIRGVLLFGIPAEKDEVGSLAWHEDGIIQRALREIKRELPKLTVITDLCFCEYTSHGHCGVLHGEQLLNDETFENLVKQANSHAGAGVDIIAPSGMLDGAIGAIRRGLDQEGFSNLPIMSYAAKFASAFYGPFREAAESAPSFGDRKSYQMDYANRREALAEVMLDVQEGADIIMVKPALAFLDIIREVRDRIDLPLAAYNVSGEYSMIKAAAERGWIDGEKVMVETLTAIRRAGADLVITYFAEEFAQWVRKS